MELVKLGFHTLQDVLQAGSDQLLDILKKLADGESTLKRYRGHDGHNSSAMRSAHIRVAKELGGESLVERCYAENGTEYKKAIHDLLVFTKAFTVTVIDDGKRQFVLDLAFDQVVRQTMVAGIVITVVGVTTGIGIGGGSIDGDRRGNGQHGPSERPGH